MVLVYNTETISTEKWFWYYFIKKKQIQYIMVLEYNSPKPSPQHNGFDISCSCILKFRLKVLRDEIYVKNSSVNEDVNEDVMSLSEDSICNEF